MAEARIAQHTATLKQYQAINDDGSLVDVRTIARLHPEYTDETMALIAATKTKLKQAKDDLSKKRRIEADPELAAKAKQQEAARKKRAKAKETPEEYELRRERERVNEAKSRAAVAADPVRAAQRSQAQHEARDTDEYRAKHREAYAANADHYRIQALQYYQKQKEEGRVPVPNFDVQAARQRAAQNYQASQKYLIDLVYYSGSIHNIAVKISDAQILELVQQPCYYCGTTTERIGVDRKDSNGVYELSNVLPACTTCNMMKGGHLPEVFIERCRDVYLHMCDSTVKSSCCAPTIVKSFQLWKSEREGKGHLVTVTASERDTLLANPCVFCGAIGNMTLDRDLPDAGYQLANLQTACYFCNMLKRELTTLKFQTRCANVALKHPPVVVATSSGWQCQLCNTTVDRCYATTYCVGCYYQHFFKKSRLGLKNREGYTTVRSKTCELCGQRKKLSSFIEPSCSVCLVCQSGDDY